MDPQIAAAIIGASSTVLAAVAGFGAVYWQIGRQARLSRNALSDAEGRRLRTRMYEDGVGAARKLAGAAVDYSTFLAIALTEVGRASAAKKHGDHPFIPSARFVRSMELNRELSTAAFDLIFLIENSRIIDPRLIVFRSVLSSALHDLRHIDLTVLSDVFMRAVPHPQVDGQLFPYEPPMDVHLAELDVAIQSTQDILNDIIGYGEDFIVEMQNTMLGDVFETRLDHRVAADPRCIVVRLDDHEQIEERLKDSPWGQQIAFYENQAKAKPAI